MSPGSNPRPASSGGASTRPDGADPRVVRARWLLLGLFALNGLTYASWLARLPAVRDLLALSTGELGTVLVASSVGSLLTVMVAGAVVTRYGGRVALTASAVGFTISFVLIGIGPAVGSVPLLAIGVFVNGASYAIGNVPMNVESAEVERRLGRSVLPQFHAAFSIGAVLGSGVGALASHHGVPVLLQFTVTAVAALAWRLASIPGSVLTGAGRAVVVVTPTGGAGSSASVGVSRPARPRRPAREVASVLDAWREPRTLLIGVVVMAAAMSEGAANDWLALAVVDGFGQKESVGAAMFGVFLASMTTVRLLGTRLIDRFGRVAVLRGSGVCGLIGLATFALTPSLLVATVGAVAWGFGAALAVPIGISAASDDPLRAAARVSVVSAFSSVAAMTMPPLLGFAAEPLGVRHALLIITVAMVASMVVAGAAARRDLAPAEPATCPEASDEPAPRDPLHTRGTS